MRKVLLLAFAAIVVGGMLPSNTHAQDGPGQAALDAAGVHAVHMIRDFLPVVMESTGIEFVVQADISSQSPEDMLTSWTTYIDEVNSKVLDAPKIGDKAFLKVTQYEGSARIQSDMYVISGDVFYSFSAMSDAKTSTDALVQFATDFFKAGGTSVPLETTPTFMVDFVALLPGLEHLPEHSLWYEDVKFTYYHNID